MNRVFMMRRVTVRVSLAASFWAVALLLGCWLASSSSSRAQPAFTNISLTPLTAGLGWQGGGGPFLLQRKAGIQDANWVNVMTTSNLSTSVARDLSISCYRLQQQASNVVLPFTVLMAGSNEMPTAISSPGIAIGTLALEGSNLTYNITFSGLTTNATAGHIHGLATPTNSAGVLVGFSVPPATAGAFSGTAVLTPDQVAALINGMLYANIHTTANPGGEIRGQIVPARIGMALSATAEVPSVASLATAAGHLTLVGNTLFYDLTYTGLTGGGIAAHIHGPAGTGANANVLVGLAAPSGPSGTISGSVTLSPLQLYFLLAGQTYINMHSTSFPNGEIRGQIYPMQLGATMTGGSEVPPTGSAAVGSMAMNITNSVLTYSVFFSGLAANASAAHIHGPAVPGVNANVLIPLSPPAATSGNFSGSASLSSLNLFYLVTGQTYVNIHDTPFPNGEIRGQNIPGNF
jgi:hypothetical protein